MPCEALLGSFMVWVFRNLRPDWTRVQPWSARIRFCVSQKFKGYFYAFLRNRRSTHKFVYLVHRFVDEEESQATDSLHGSGEATAHPPSAANLDTALETIPPSRIFFEEDWQTRWLSIGFRHCTVLSQIRKGEFDRIQDVLYENDKYELDEDWTLLFLA